MALDLLSSRTDRSDAVPKVSLRQLTYFLAAANQESVLRAAETLNVSSPSISTAIAQIEDALGVQLFVRRHARGLLLTSAGRDLAAHARSLILHAREIESSTNRTAAQLNIGCQATLAPYLLPPLLRTMALSHPQLELRWREDNHEGLLDSLHSGATDLIILYDYDLPSTLHVTPLRLMPLQAVLPSEHRLAVQDACSLQELADEPLILLDHPKTRDYFLAAFGEAALEPRIAHRTTSYEMVRSLVANGFGYSLLNFCPPYVVEGHGRITARPLRGIDRSQNLVLARLFRYRAPRLIEDLIRLIRTSFADVKISTA